MTFDPETVEAVAFDSYGTIVDVMAVEEPLSEYVDSPEVVAKLWRNRSLGYAIVGNAIEEYDSFYDMNRRALQYALETLGIDLSEEEREEILSTYQELPVFDDVHDGLERLRDGGYDSYIVSNGSKEMLKSMIEHGDLENLITDHPF